jgi:hypothetical protein
MGCGVLTADMFGDVGPACTTVPGRRTASPLQPMETRLVHMILHATGRRCRGDPVGRPWGAAHASRRVRSRGAGVHNGARATHRVAPTADGNAPGPHDPLRYRRAM